MAHRTAPLRCSTPQPPPIPGWPACTGPRVPAVGSPAHSTQLSPSLRGRSSWSSTPTTGPGPTSYGGWCGILPTRRWRRLRGGALRRHGRGRRGGRRVGLPVLAPAAPVGTRPSAGVAGLPPGRVAEPAPLALAEGRDDDVPPDVPLARAGRPRPGRPRPVARR